MAVVGRDRLVDAARATFGDGPFIIKPNRGGKGLDVSLLESSQQLSGIIASPDLTEPLDGVYLLQQYVQAPEPVITRAEFVGGRFLYAVEVSTSGGFELCPADICAVPDETRPPFKVVETVDPALTRGLERFLQLAGIEIAGIEFATGRDGVPLVYDVNTNTNYNAEAEAAAGLAVTGMRAIADFLNTELQKSVRKAA